MTKQILYQDNTQQIKLFGVMDDDTQVFWTTGSITATLLDQDGARVVGCVGVNLLFQPGSNGDYFGVVGTDFSPDIGDGYVLVVDGDQSASHLHLEIPIEVRARTS